MGKASSSKKVARAATTGGGRTRRGARPWGWYTVMVLLAALGVATIVYSRNERQAALNPLKSEKPRPPDRSRGFPGDHWHAAFGVYLCNDFMGDISTERDPLGIHPHNDGVIHIHPFTRAASGRRAKLGVFTETVGMRLTEDEFRLPGPGQETHREGDDCGGKDAILQVFLNGKEHLGDPKEIRLRDRDVIVVALAPEGEEIPEPPSADRLDNLSDVPGSPSATSSTTQVPRPEGATPGTSVPAAPPAAPAGQPPPPTTATTIATGAPPSGAP